ncbi:5635_t:CDS:10 [Funneliformis geosporum]|nr:5635_t:CDS:10 [Funneliformis geosporum]
MEIHSNDESSIFYTLIVGTILLIIFYMIRRPRTCINEPPLVPYSIPIIGHTYNYLLDTKSFIRKCKEQYGDCFSLYVLGREITIISGNSINDVFRCYESFNNVPEVNELLSFHQIFNYNYGLNLETVKRKCKTTKEYLSSNPFIPIVQKYLVKEIDNLIGECKDPKIISNVWFMVNSIITLSMARVLIGEDVGSHKNSLNALANLSFELGPLLSIPPVLSFIHPRLHKMVVTLSMKFGWGPISYNRKLLISCLQPVIKKRVEEKRILHNKHKPYNDLLEYYMNQTGFDFTNPDNIPDLFLVAFAAIGTTSKATINALYDLASRPECLSELYEEAFAIDKECNGSITLTDIQKMEKLDSFVKESLRHTGDTITFPHTVIPERYTFSNGYTVPKGRIINMYTESLLKSKESYGDDAEEFKPYQFVNKNSPATNVDRSYIIFGGGKRSCPGRFFAVNEIKLALHKLILRYHIETKSGIIENKFILGPITLPPRNSLIFKDRN